MMKVLGIVLWTNQDRHGSPIARVRPLVEIHKGEWREIIAQEEFPTQGQVFWPNAHAATEDSLIIFRAEPNHGQRDEFTVADPKLAYEVLDLRRYGTEGQVRAALVEGIRLRGPLGTVRGLIWCSPDLLVGPVGLNRVATGTIRLADTDTHRLAAYTGARIRPLVVDGVERLLRVDDSAPSSFVDWDDDAIILRRALEAAVKVAKQAGHQTDLTKKQIAEAANSVALQGIGTEAQLDRYRIERAIVLLDDTDVVANQATKFIELLCEHPVIHASLEAVSATVRSDVEKVARNDLEQQLVSERAALKEAAETHARTTAQLNASKQELRDAKQELRGAEERLAQVQFQAASAAKEAEDAVEERVLAALERPLDLLAEVSVLRPFLGAGGGRAAGGASASPAPTRLDWSRTRGEFINDKASLRSILKDAARARGVHPALMLQIHAATMAQLMPVTLGPGALGALTAYAHGACGGRSLIVHVSPSAILPQDLEHAPGGGLVAAAAAAAGVDGVSLVVLEGANRSPLEASVVPLLQLADLGLPPLVFAGGLRLAASLVAGATTVPVTPQMWSHAVAIYPEPISPSMTPVATGDITLTSELFTLGDVPEEAIGNLLEAWPDCNELRPAMGRFGSALSRFYDEESRVTIALRDGLILPYIATAISVEEQAEAVSKAGDADGTIAEALRRLRRKLC